MSDWAEEVAAVTAVAQQMQAAESVAEAQFDAAHARAAEAGTLDQVNHTPELREWLAARHATDAAWGQWAMLMDNKPAG